jgi:hypothetical protein
MKSKSVKRIGADIISLNTFENWYDTGDNYDYVRFPLKKTRIERWKAGCQSLLPVNGILAGFSATVVAVLISTTDGSTDGLLFVQGCIALLVSAFVLLVLSAEWMADALELGNVYTYRRSVLPYNLGVISLLSAVSLFLYSKDYFDLLWLVPLLATIYPWWCDICWQLFADRSCKNAYIEKLVGEI